MRVKVKFFASAREIVGAREEILEIEEPTLIIDLLRLLAKRHGEKFSEYLFDTNTGSPKSYLQFLVNDKPITMLKGFETRLANDDVLVIFPPVRGG